MGFALNFAILVLPNPNHSILKSLCALNKEGTRYTYRWISKLFIYSHSMAFTVGGVSHPDIQGPWGGRGAEVSSMQVPYIIVAWTNFSGNSSSPGCLSNCAQCRIIYIKSIASLPPLVPEGENRNYCPSRSWFIIRVLVVFAVPPQALGSLELDCSFTYKLPQCLTLLQGFMCR